MKKSNFRRWNFFLSRISNTIKLIKKKIKRDSKHKTYQVLVADITHHEMHLFLALVAHRIVLGEKLVVDINHFQRPVHIEMNRHEHWNKKLIELPDNSNQNLFHLSQMVVGVANIKGKLSLPILSWKISTFRVHRATEE